MPVGVHSRKSLAARFHCKVVIGVPPAHCPELGPCYLWTASCGTSGYGQIMRDGKPVGAHVVGWELKNGPVPEGMHVLHHCDTKRCVRDEHLFLGNQQKNMRDMWDKRRGALGEQNGQSKLTAPLARAARLMRADGLSQARIARILGVSPGCIQKILEGKTWKHVLP